MVQHGCDARLRFSKPLSCLDAKMCASRADITSEYSRSTGVFLNGRTYTIHLGCFRNRIWVAEARVTF